MCDNDKSRTFVDCVLSGDARDTDIDDFIDQWTASRNGGSLASFLGFTDKEYALWVEEPEALQRILNAKGPRAISRAE